MSTGREDASGPLLVLDRIFKSYARRRVLKDLSLEIREGETVLLLGPNGAGKSTLLRVIAGLLRADKGRRIWAEGRALSYFGHRLQLYPGLTVQENLSFFNTLSPSAGPLADLLKAWDLAALEQRTVRNLSKGQQIRAALARAFLGDPDLLLLDEPTASLDEAGLGLLRRHLTARAERGRATVVVTHDISRVPAPIDRALILTEGAIARDSRIDCSAPQEVLSAYAGTT